MFNKDKEILRELGKKLADIAALPVQETTKKEWYALHNLKPTRPMFMIDELPWHEMNVDDELTLRCENPTAQLIETNMRRQLYRWNHFRDDFVYEPKIYVPMKINGIGAFPGYSDGYEALQYGITPKDDVVHAKDDNRIASHSYKDMLRTEDDLEKLTYPDLTLNEEATNARAEIAHEALDGVLEVIMNGYIPFLNTWDNIIVWRGFENVLNDLIDNPEFIHKTVDRVTDITIKALEQLEDRGLLGHPQQQIHCCGAWCDDLPKAGYNPDKPRAIDVWTYGMAQIFCTVSPEMHNEFEVEYAKKWYGRFGHGYYGCCEPLEDRMNYVKSIPNILKVSVSAWVKDYDKFAEQLEGKYVYSSKPTPAFLAAWNPEAVEADIRKLIGAAKKYNCPCEFTLKDISTVDYKPEHVWEWADIMRKICHE